MNAAQANHRKYLRSATWQVKRQAALEYAGGRCQVCNSGDGLQVHHRTYERFQHEDPADLTVLCAQCHSTVHAGLFQAPGDRARKRVLLTFARLMPQIDTEQRQMIRASVGELILEMGKTLCVLEGSGHGSTQKPQA